MNTYLTDLDMPGVVRLPPESKTLLDQLCRHAVSLGFSTWTLDGNNMKDKSMLMTHFDQQLEISSWFPQWGRNWDALYDVLRSLEDRGDSKGYLLVLTSPGAIKIDDLRELVSILHDASEYWANWKDQRIPFKSILLTGDISIAVPELRQP